MKAVKTVIVCAGVIVGACGSLHGLPPAEIRFVSYGEHYATKPDFAQVEHEFPLTPAHLAKLTPEMLAAYDQEQIDQIYARLAAGVIPDGLFDAQPFFPKHAPHDRTTTEMASTLSDFANVRTTRFKLLGKYLWGKKVFQRDAHLALTRVDDLTPLEHLLSGDRTTIPRITVDGRKQWLMFPARLYCGQSLLDSRRESIVVDYYFNDEISGYHGQFNYLPGRYGMQVRDEIRLIRPGFYLGRAYLGKVFLLNFTLYDKNFDQHHGDVFSGTDATRQDCWQGEQAQPMVSKSEN